MKREDIPNRVDLRLRYSFKGLLSNQDYIFGVLIFLSTSQSEVEKSVERLKQDTDVDVYLLLFEEGHEVEVIKDYVQMFREAFPDLEIRSQVGYPKETMDYMYAQMEAIKEKREAKLN